MADIHIWHGFVFSFKSSRKASTIRGRIAGIILQGIARHAFPCPPAALAGFEAELETFSVRFENANDDHAALQLACEVVESLQTYAATTERFIVDQAQQLRDTVAHLAGSLSLKAALEDAHSTGDLVALNAALRSFADRIGEEALEQRRRNAEILQDLDRAARMDVDAGTGLPGVSSAVRAVRAALDQGVTRQIYAFRLENIEATNRRFGLKAADRVLLYFAQYVAQRLGANDVLFRWRGPCFLAVSAGAGQALAASDVAKIVAARLEYSIEIGPRRVDVPVVGSWNMLTVTSKSSMDDVLLRLDEFAIRGTRPTPDA